MDHHRRGKSLLKNIFTTSKNPVFLFAQGDYEFYELGDRFYKVDRQSNKVLSADRRNEEFDSTSK